MGEYSCDNSGNRVVPDVNVVNPVAASGQVVATGNAGDDKTFTVTGGKIYALSGIGTAILVSITGVTSTAANVEWVGSAGQTILVKVPIGKTTIYLEGDTDSKNVYLREVAD